MTLVNWNETMKLGVPEVDFEHEELIGVINALGDQIHKGETLDGIQALLDEINAQIEAHFALEEKIMRKNGFVGPEAHKEDHDRLLEQIRDIMTEAVGVDEDVLHAHLAQRLDMWFSEHFRTLYRSFHSLDDN